jgi:hypothetical protein
MPRDIEIATGHFFWTPIDPPEGKKNRQRADTSRNGNHKPPTEVFFSFSLKPNGDGRKAQLVWARARVVAIDRKGFVLQKPGHQGTFRRKEEDVSLEDPRLSS